MSNPHVISAPFFFFFFNDTATTEIYTLSLHDALPICSARATAAAVATPSCWTSTTSAWPCWMRRSAERMLPNGQAAVIDMAVRAVGDATLTRHRPALLLGALREDVNYFPVLDIVLPKPSFT